MGWNIVYYTPPQDAPAYIEALDAFEVLQLTGMASNGKDTMEDVTPAEWLPNATPTPPGNFPLAGVIVAWCGGGKSAGRKLRIYGGGHNDAANNGLYSYDFGGTVAPTGFELLDISAVSAVREHASKTYSDGRPASTHGYDGGIDIGTAMLRFGGAAWGDPTGFDNSAFKFTYGGAWATLTNTTGTDGGEPTVVRDPSSGKVLVGVSNSFNAWQFFNPSNNTYGSSSAAGRTPANALGAESASAYDHTRSRMLSIGSGVRILTDVDWSAETISTATQALSGAAIPTGAGFGLCYDSVRDAFWLFGGNASSDAYANLYEIDAATFAVTKHALSASMAGFETNYQGLFSRFCYSEEDRFVGLLTRSDAAPFVVKLPS